jgi:hypothetical protein
VGVGEDFLGGYQVRGLAQGAEEVEEHSGVGLDGAAEAGALLLLGQEGVDGLLPAVHLATNYQSLGGHGLVLQQVGDEVDGLRVVAMLAQGVHNLVWHRRRRGSGQWRSSR